MEGQVMRLPRVRFTMRRMMIAVAVVGLLIGWGIESERRRVRFERLWRRYYKLAGIALPILERFPVDCIG
jgi:hypothetical protein